MLDDDLTLVDQAALKAICTERRSESTTLDFKQQLPDTSDKDKAELLKDVSAMANGDGGDLVYGIAESDGAAAGIYPIANEAPDAAKRRLLGVLDGLDPRVRVQAREVTVDGGYVLVLRVPASFDGPHWIRMPGGGGSTSNRRFVIRNGTGTTDMTYEQLRTAFDRTSTLRQRAEQFREQRLLNKRNSRSPVALTPGPICVLHVTPLSGLAKRQALSVAELMSDAARWLALGKRQKYAATSFRRLNLDGFVGHTHYEEKPSAAYVQVFRDGCVEAVCCVSAREVNRAGDRPEKVLSGELIAEHVRNALKTTLVELRSSGFEGPALVFVSLIKMQRFGLQTSQHYGGPAHATGTVADDELLIPAGWIDQLQTANVDDVARPLLDVLWQAFNFERCDFFHRETGKFALGD